MCSCPDSEIRTDGVVKGLDGGFGGGDGEEFYFAPKGACHRKGSGQPLLPFKSGKKVLVFLSDLYKVMNLSCLLVLGEAEECQLLWRPLHLLPGQLPRSGDLTRRRAFGTAHKRAFCAACCAVCHDFWPVQPQCCFSSWAPEEAELKGNTQNWAGMMPCTQAVRSSWEKLLCTNKVC